MASGIGRWISRWIWGSNDEDAPDSSLKAFPDFSSELEYLKILHGGTGIGAGVGPNFGRAERKRRREEEKFDRENDMVIVSSDGEFWSSSESEDSDWSVGWLEPNAPEFQSENDKDNSFAVIVPCYGRGRSRQSVNRGSESNGLGAFNFLRGDHPDSKNYIEEWLSSFQKIDTEVTATANMGQPKLI